MDINEARMLTKNCVNRVESFDDTSWILESEDGMVLALVSNSSVVAIIDIKNQVLTNVKCDITRLTARYYNDFMIMCDMTGIVRKICERENFRSLMEFMTNIEWVDLKNRKYKVY